MYICRSDCRSDHGCGGRFDTVIVVFKGVGSGDPSLSVTIVLSVGFYEVSLV